MTKFLHALFIVGMALFFFCFLSVIYALGWFLFKITFGIWSL